VSEEVQPPAGAFALRDFLGMDLRQREPGVCSAALTASDAHLNPHGTVHGAVLFTMVDTAMGGATMSVLDEGLLCASIDVHLRFLKPVFGGELEATAEVVRAGKRVVHLEARVRGGDGETVAMATGAFAVLGG
jgi:acyl-CoA thioesterase